MRSLMLTLVLALAGCHNGYDLDVRDPSGAFVYSETFASKERCEMYGKQKAAAYGAPANVYDQFDDPSKMSDDELLAALKEPARADAKGAQPHTYVCTRRTAR